MSSVQINDRILIRYRILDAVGLVLEDSGEAPVAITVGDGSLPTLVENALLGRKIEEDIRIEVDAADEVFGRYDENKIQPLPRSQFGDFGEVEAGMLLEFALPDGEGVAGCITQVAEDEVTVDFNHPLIGRDCVYEMHFVGFAESVEDQNA
jgi:FKBP-type peptidyl-prolyl cis-trans isomerase 2